jgi:hypothetical protein
MQISARGILATIAASAGQNGHFSKVGTVYVYLLSLGASKPKTLNKIAKISPGYL